MHARVAVETERLQPAVYITAHLSISRRDHQQGRPSAVHLRVEVPYRAVYCAKVLVKAEPPPGPARGGPVGEQACVADGAWLVLRGLLATGRVEQPGERRSKALIKENQRR